MSCVLTPAKRVLATSFAACGLMPACESDATCDEGILRGIVRGFPADSKWFVVHIPADETLEEALRNPDRHARCGEVPDDVAVDRFGNVEIQCLPDQRFSGTSPGPLVARIGGTQVVVSIVTTGCNRCVEEVSIEASPPIPPGNVVVIRTKQTLCTDQPDAPWHF